MVLCRCARTPTRPHAPRTSPRIPTSPPRDRPSTRRISSPPWDTFTKAVQEAPNAADAHSRLGYSYRKLGSYDKSKESYLKALKIDSRHRGAREYLGELYLVLNQLSDAERELQA